MLSLRIRGYSVYDRDFRQLGQLDDMETGDGLFTIADLVLTDPWYNGQKKALKASSKHDVLTWDDVRYLTKRYSEVMALGSDEHIFRAWLLVAGWYETLMGQKGEVPGDKRMEGKDGAVQKPAFELKAKQPL